MPGIPAYTVASGIQMILGGKVDVGLQHQWQDKMPLNNTNTDWAPARHILFASISAGFNNRKQNRWDLALVLQNLTSTRYTSFFQFNAGGGRYYNPAPPLNASFRVSYTWSRHPNRDSASEK